MQYVRSLILYIAIVILGLVSFYCGLSAWLDHGISKCYLRDPSAFNHMQGVDEKDKGDALLEQTLSQANLVLMGSSELSSPVDENPAHLFPNNLYETDVTMIGHAGVQNAIHAMTLGSANSELFANKDVVMIESLQWYMDEDTDPGAFFSNFSELHFYEFLYNDKISPANKEYLCRRYIQMEQKNFADGYEVIGDHIVHDDPISKFVSGLFGVLKGSGYKMFEGSLTFPETYVLADLYVSDSIAGRGVYYITRPYYWMRHKVLSLKDKYDAYLGMRQVSEHDEQRPISIDWNELYTRAMTEGEQACTNNDLFVYDDYYTTYLRDDFEEKRGMYDNTPLMESGEWDDLDFFLGVCKDLGIKPYIVAMSANGRYYDHVGFDKGERDELYDRIAYISKQNGVDCLMIKDKEYEPYFYCDVMHLGWKGWPYVIENIIDHFSE